IPPRKLSSTRIRCVCVNIVCDGVLAVKVSAAGGMAWLLKLTLFCRRECRCSVIDENVAHMDCSKVTPAKLASIKSFETGDLQMYRQKVRTNWKPVTAFASRLPAAVGGENNPQIPQISQILIKIVKVSLSECFDLKSVQSV